MRHFNNYNNRCSIKLKKIKLKIINNQIYNNLQTIMPKTE